MHCNLIVMIKSVPNQQCWNIAYHALIREEKRLLGPWNSHNGRKQSTKFSSDLHTCSETHAPTHLPTHTPHTCTCTHTHPLTHHIHTSAHTHIHHTHMCAYTHAPTHHTHTHMCACTHSHIMRSHTRPIIRVTQTLAFDDADTHPPFEALDWVLPARVCQSLAFYLFMLSSAVLY